MWELRIREVIRRGALRIEGLKENSKARSELKTFVKEDIILSRENEI